MTWRERTLLALTVVGFLVPNAMLTVFVIEHGFDLGRFLGNAVETLPAAQLTMDLIIAAVAFVLWSVWEGRRLGMRTWWLSIPATALVGLCFALPLSLLLRERALRAHP